MSREGKEERVEETLRHGERATSTSANQVAGSQQVDIHQHAESSSSERTKDELLAEYRQVIESQRRQLAAKDAAAETLKLIAAQEREEFMERLQEQQHYAVQAPLDSRHKLHSTAFWAAASLPTPMSAIRPHLAPLLPRVPDPRRLSFGQSLRAIEESPAPVTPARGAPPASMQPVRAPDVAPPASSASAEQDAADRADDRDRKILQAAVAMAKESLKPFHADTDLDKNTTVLDFVETAETAMEDGLVPPRLRLAFLRRFLKEGALRWVNLRMIQWAEQVASIGGDVSKQPLTYGPALRAEFIQAHKGTDTLELWLAQLTALEVGRGKKCKDPVELESKFDSIARHIYPQHSVGSDDRADLLLVTKYKDIVLRSQPEMYKQIVLSRRSHEIMTLRDWKNDFAHVWTVHKELQAMQQPAGAHRQQGGHSQRGRGGGRVWNSSSSTSQGSGPVGRTQTVSAMEVEENGRAEGETANDETDEEPPHQLSAAAGGGQRGGKAARGGRGRTAGPAQRQEQPRQQRPPLTAEQRQRFIDGLCINCGEEGHIALRCPKAKAGSQ